MADALNKSTTQRPPVHLGPEPWQPVTAELEKWLPGFLSMSEAGLKEPNDALPSADRLNQGFDYRNNNGKVLQFVPQDASLPFFHMAYEERIWHHGLIATRNNWHDFFNALVWRTFPRIKSALNTIHWRQMQHHESPSRSARRDAVTLFDECGIIVLGESPAPLHDIRKHRWESVFASAKNPWQHRTGPQALRAITFGHAMFEKYLRPYEGLTAKSALLCVPAGFIQQLDTNYAAAIHWLDQRLAGAILHDEFLCHSQELAPLPVLGIPGWWLNRPRDFWRNSRYFRPPSQRTGERKIYVLS